MVNQLADEGYIRLAIGARGNKEWEKEKGYLRSGLDSNPESILLRIALGEALLRRGEYLSAGVYFQMVLTHGNARERSRVQQSVDDALHSIEIPTSINDPRLEAIVTLYELQEKMSEGDEKKREKGYEQLAQLYCDLGLYASSDATSKRAGIAKIKVELRY